MVAKCAVSRRIRDKARTSLKKLKVMKNFIVTLVAMLVVFCANAQTISCISTRDAQACGEYLVKNPQDTIVNQFRVELNGMNGIVTRSVYMKHGRLYAKNDTTYVRRSANDTISVYPRMTETEKKSYSYKKEILSLIRESAGKYGISPECHHLHGISHSLQKTSSVDKENAKKQTKKEKTLFCSSFLLICTIGSLGGALVAKKAK